MMTFFRSSPPSTSNMWNDSDAGDACDSVVLVPSQGLAAVTAAGGHRRRTLWRAVTATTTAPIFLTYLFFLVALSSAPFSTSSSFCPVVVSALTMSSSGSHSARRTSSTSHSKKRSRINLFNDDDDDDDDDDDSINNSNIPKKTRSRIIPITVLSGFLGTGKTSLLQHMLQNKQGLKIGVVVNDVASVNIDSKLVAQRRGTSTGSNSSNGGSAGDIDDGAILADGMVELQNGCACCSLSDELLTSVANLVTLSDLRQQGDEDDDDDENLEYVKDKDYNKNSRGGLDHIVIELSGVADPKAIRAKFQEAIMEQMPLMERVQLDTMVSLIDCSTFESHFRSTQLATPEEMPQLFYLDDSQLPPSDESIMEQEEWMKDLPPKLLQVVLQSMKSSQQQQQLGEPEGVADLLTSQTETADLVVLNKEDLVDAAELARLQEIISALNPRAKVITTSFGNVDLMKVLGVAGGEGVAVAGAVDDHRDYVLAATNAADESLSHAHSHDHACEDSATCTDPSHSHSHDHASAETKIGEEACADPGCTDSNHSHSHSHNHDISASANKPQEDACADPGCTDPNHSHSHSHNHDVLSSANKPQEEACADSGCTDPTHSHSHSHDHSRSVGGDQSSSATFVGIGSFVYRARRPFHPGRLVSFLRYLPVKRGIPESMNDHNDHDSNNAVFVPAETQDKLKQCLRSKGFVWCANSHTDALYWSHAGSTFELACLGQWWATLPRDQWPAGVHEYVLRDFDIPDHDDATNPVGVGDRRQEIVFIGPTLGEGLAQQLVTQSLDQCLLTDQEYEEYQSLVTTTTTTGGGTGKGEGASDQQLQARFNTSFESRYVPY